MKGIYGLVYHAAFALAIQLLYNVVILPRLYRSGEAQRIKAGAGSC
jgi:hypothetical protein